MYVYSEKIDMADQGLIIILGNDFLKIDLKWF